jgi:hypothetical protein
MLPEKTRQEMQPAPMLLHGLLGPRPLHSHNRLSSLSAAVDETPSHGRLPPIPTSHHGSSPLISSKMKPETTDDDGPPNAYASASLSSLKWPSRFAAHSVPRGSAFYLPFSRIVPCLIHISDPW